MMTPSRYILTVGVALIGWLALAAAFGYDITRFDVKHQGTTAVLSWQHDDSGADRMQGVGYMVEHAVSGVANTNMIKVTRKTYEATALQPGKRHRFRVKVIHHPSDLGTPPTDGQWSKWISIDVGSGSGGIAGVGSMLGPIHMVSNLRIGRQGRNGRSLELNWDDLYPNANTVYIVEHTSPTRKSEARTNQKMLTFDSLALGSHRFRVKIRHNTGDGRFSDGPWSGTLGVDISQFGGGGTRWTTPRGPTVTTLRAPANFKAFVQNPTSLHLEWEYEGQEPSGLYYMVKVIRDHDESTAQHIQIDNDQFTISSLEPGRHYQLSVKAALSAGQQSGYSRNVNIKLPTYEEFFAVEQLQVSSRPTGPQDVANISWSVPQNKKQLIVGYTVHYSVKEPNGDEGHWYQRYFPGSRNNAQLSGLTPDTQYYVKVHTHLRDGTVTTSSLYTVTLPPVNGVNKVDIIYLPNTNQIKLQWVVSPTVPLNDIVGYDILVSKDRDAPAHQWRVYKQASRQPEFMLPALDPNHTYYVKFNILKRDGTTLQGRTTFRFNTVAQANVEVRQPMQVHYTNIDGRTFTLNWAYPADLNGRIQGATVMYTDDRNKPEAEWMKYLVSGGITTLRLSGLVPNKMYYVRIMPRLANGQYVDNGGQMVYTINTGIPGRNTAGGTNTISVNVDDRRDQPNPDQSEQLCLIKCRPLDEFRERRCPMGERCVASYRNSVTGWCVSQSFIAAVKSSGN